MLYYDDRDYLDYNNIDELYDDDYVFDDTDEDIEDVKIVYSRKRIVTIYIKNGSRRRLYLYKADTLKKLIHDAVERVNGEAQNPEVVDAPEEDDLSKLERLAKLHESGALNDEEFAQAKKKILG